MNILARTLAIPRLRLLSQSLYAVFFLVVGAQFYQFYLWATGASDQAVTRPPAVEAFLPIGALVSLKRLLLSGEYDTIHPAGLTLFLAVMVTSIFLRKGFCGWICPIGFASNLAARAGEKMGILCTIPLWLDRLLLSLKYLLLAAFGWLILWNMNLEDLTAFHFSTYNLISDAKMLHFFLEPSRLASAIMLILVALSFVVKNPWCRFLCPYGALSGILACASPLRVHRDPQRCVDCHQCERVCPAAIRITAREAVRDNECIGCLECLPVCPRKECLTLIRPGRKTTPPLLLPTLLLGSFFLFWLWAEASGHWHTQIPTATFRELYPQTRTIGHP